MKPFKKDKPTEAATAPVTPYQRAKQEWDERIGSSVQQAKNWRILAFCAILLALFLLAILLISLARSRDKVFVAEVTKEGRVVNIAPLAVTYQPTVAQKEYFVAGFIKAVRSVSLDPVVTKNNLLNAYKFLTHASAEKLNTYLRENNPLDELGKKTVVVEVNNMNPISDTTLEAGWTEISTDVNGQKIGEKTYSGVFTVAVRAPTTQEEILANPLGIFIVDFNVSARN